MAEWFLVKKISVHFQDIEPAVVSLWPANSGSNAAMTGPSSDPKEQVTVFQSTAWRRPWCGL
jgi:hypothetical protein